MKKLLLLALIPGLTFAYQTNMETIPRAFGGSVNMNVLVGGHYVIGFKNNGHRRCTYKYTLKLCAQDKNCKIHETEYHLDPGEERVRSHELTDNVKYNLPGRYKLTAIQEINGCGLNESDRADGNFYVFN